MLRLMFVKTNIEIAKEVQNNIILIILDPCILGYNRALKIVFFDDRYEDCINSDS